MAYDKLSFYPVVKCVFIIVSFFHIVENYVKKDSFFNSNPDKAAGSKTVTPVRKILCEVILFSVYH